MKNLNYKFVLAAICLVSFLSGFSKVNAAPVQFNEVVQFVNAKPGKATTGSFSRLSLSTFEDPAAVTADDDDDKKKKDGRVITEASTTVEQEQTCPCDNPPPGKKFPKWALLGLAAIPIAIILIRRDKDKKHTPTPTMTIPITQTMTPTPTPKTPTPTPMTPTPTPPEPVPEPMTILLFGTGLAGIGMAARRRFGKKEDKEENEG